MPNKPTSAEEIEERAKRREQRRRQAEQERLEKQWRVVKMGLLQYGQLNESGQLEEYLIENTPMIEGREIEEAYVGKEMVFRQEIKEGEPDYDG